MNFREFFLATKNNSLYDVHSSFSNNYLLKHGNILSCGARNEIFIPIPQRTFLNGPKPEAVNPKDVSQFAVCSSVQEAYSPSSESPLSNDNGKQETWILGNQKLSWDNSTVASYNPETKMFRCVVCNAVGFLSRIAEHYLGTHTSAKVFQCMHCPYSSTWSRCVRMHMAKHHGVPNAPPSLWKGQPLLEEIFHLLNMLKSSVDCLGKEKNEAPDKKFVCSKCPYNTDRRDLYLRHENIHKEEKPYHCYLCFKLFNRADHVKKHFLRIHRGQPYEVALVRRHPPESREKTLRSDEDVCNFTRDQDLLAPNEPCGEDLSEERIKNSLKDGKENSPERTELMTPEHSARVPTVDFYYLVCAVCGHIFADRDSLIRHVISVHKNVICANDNRIYRSENSNISEGPWQIDQRGIHHQYCLSCKVTGNSIIDRNSPSEGVKNIQTNESSFNLIKFMRYNDSERRELTNGPISKLSSSKSNLEKTTRWQTTKQDLIPFKPNIISITGSLEDPDSGIQPKWDHSNDCDIICKHCGCEFADLTSMETHTTLYHRSHSSAGYNKNKKPFVCVLCHYCCVTQVTMMEHMRYHSGPSLKCFAGRLCTFSAVYDSELRAHVAQRHNDGVTRCPHCGFPCSPRSAFVLHYRFSHHPFPCVLCKNTQQALKGNALPSSKVPRGRQSTEKIFFSDSKQEIFSARRCRKQSSPRKIIQSERCRGRTSQTLLPLVNAKTSWWWRRCKSSTFETEIQQVHICRFCKGRSVHYKNKKNLIVHRLWFHSRRKFVCFTCGARFKLYYRLLMHTRKLHSTKNDQEFPLPLISRTLSS